jgi:hypothetical protein
MNSSSGRGEVSFGTLKGLTFGRQLVHERGGTVAGGGQQLSVFDKLKHLTLLNSIPIEGLSNSVILIVLDRVEKCLSFLNRSKFDRKITED